MKYSIAAVSFLNTVPLVEHLVTLPSDQVDLHLALPSRLASLLESGDADVALVPVVEIFRGRAAGLISNTGIACRGSVDSVKMFHTGPLLGIKRVLADRGSRSSVALLGVLLKEMHGLEPEFSETTPIPGVLPKVEEGLLVIGDRCFEFEREFRAAGKSDVYVIDLGQAWWELTGLPFVFAGWAVSHDFHARASGDNIAALARLLDTSRDIGLKDLDQLAAREAANGRLGHKGDATTEAVAYYFRESLQYHLGDEEMAGMARFHELCIKHGVVPDGPPPLLLRG